jgi:excisionase family DNA binding protein
MSETTSPLARPQSVPEVARYLGLADATIWNWIADGLLVATKIGPNVTRIYPEHLADFERRRKEAAEQAAAERRSKKQKSAA